MVVKTIELRVDATFEEALRILEKQAQKSSSWRGLWRDIRAGFRLENDVVYHVDVKSKGEFRVHAGGSSDASLVFYSLWGRVVADGEGSRVQAKVHVSRLLLFARWFCVCGFLLTALRLGWSGRVKQLLALLPMATICFAVFWIIPRFGYRKAEEEYRGFLTSLYTYASKEERSASPGRNLD